MKALSVENEPVRITILVGKGSDTVERGHNSSKFEALRLKAGESIATELDLKLDCTGNTKGVSPERC
jgi:hypothetical protein